MSSNPITYTGAPTITTGQMVSGAGSPANAPYYSQAAGSSSAWNLVNTTGAATQESIVFRNIRFAPSSTNNRVEFLLSALSLAPNSGLLATDNVTVDISTDYGRTYNSVATVTGSGGGPGAVWGYQANTIAPGALTAAATFDGTTPTNPPTNYTPVLDPTINPTSNTTDLTGANGYGKVSIAFVNALNITVRITLTNSTANQVWGVDEFKVLSDAAAALPVELTHFEATAKIQGVALSWATASEKNNDRFEVQRSATGAEFQTIGSVKGQGNTSSAHDYTFEDSRPLSGLTYYRLRQVDTDGTGAYSPVASVRTQPAPIATVYPNPGATTVTLPTFAGPVRYRIFNALGQTLLSGQTVGDAQLDLSRLAKGSFFLELTTESSRTTQRLVRE